MVPSVAPLNKRQVGGEAGGEEEERGETPAWTDRRQEGLLGDDVAVEEGGWGMRRWWRDMTGQ